MNKEADVQFKRIGNVALLTLDRPQKHNAITQHMRDRLVNHFATINKDNTVRVVVITGAGDRAFCAGTDVSEFVGRSGMDQWDRDLDPNRIFEVISRSPKPVIAMINGYAFGGGCELALACDIRISGTVSEFGQLEINFGLIPGGGGTQRLTRLVGRGQAMRMILSGERIDAQEAYRIGLVEMLFPVEDLEEQTMAFARRISEHDPTVLQLAKEAIQSVDELTLSAGLRYEASLMAMCMDKGEAGNQIEKFLNSSDRDKEV